jgi:hypothetical protein
MMRSPTSARMATVANTPAAMNVSAPPLCAKIHTTPSANSHPATPTARKNHRI